MEDIRKRELIQLRLNELEALPPSYEHPAYKTWDQRTKVTLREAFGDGSRELIDFDGITFFPRVQLPGGRTNWAAAFNRGRDRARALLDGILYQMDIGGPAETPPSPQDVYAPLWAHVESNVHSKNWSIVASQAAIFLEDTLRDWTESDASTYGVDLAKRALHPHEGRFPLGETPGEQQGWHLLAMGYFSALSNRNRHRIEASRLYAVGVLGMTSLILNEITDEYGTVLP